MNITQIVGESTWATALRDSILRVARFPSSVLISGPSGTGKELVARALHAHSPRSSQPFIPVDCTSLTGGLFASHLFGHVKGAFTGADYPRIGCFRAANGGTIFLDEIGELNLELQSLLLRTIQEREVTPLGSDQAIPVDVRIVAATNRDLAEDVRAGRFRLDLFYRLNVVALETSPLRERSEDIEGLANHFLHKMAAEHGYPLKRLSNEAIFALRANDWPGNIRQLQNVLERAVVFARGDAIEADALPREINTALPIAPRTTPPSADPAVADHWLSLADMERAHICHTLERTSYNQSAAAKLLQINRATLARKIAEYRLSLPEVQRGRPRASRG